MYVHIVYITTYTTIYPMNHGENSFACQPEHRSEWDFDHGRKGRNNLGLKALDFGDTVPNTTILGTLW